MVFTKKIYEQVRELIEEDAQGKPPGAAIDTEVGYANRFGVSRPTVRKAVEDLVSIGLIQRVAGKGLIVAVHPPNRGKLLIMLPQSIGDGFFYHVTMGCVDQANHLGFEYKILSIESEAKRLEAVKLEKLDNYVATITCCYGSPEEYEILDVFDRFGLPVLLMDNPLPERSLPCVSCDDFTGGYLVGKHLTRRGHTRIVNLSNIRPALTIKRRDEGFLSALTDAGVQYDMDYYMHMGNAPGEFIRRFRPADILDGKVTAICSHTSLSIVKLSHWLYTNGIRIYDDISLVGYGDHPIMPEYGLPITSVEVPSANMGRSAVSEISQAFLEGRAFRDLMLDVKLENRNTVKNLNNLK